MAASSEYLPRLTVDLDALVHNYHTLAGLTDAAIGAVVKADAYGLGVAAVAQSLFAAGCRTFFTAHVDEGITLRRLVPDAEIILMVPAPFVPAASLLEHRLVPAIFSYAEAERLASELPPRQTLPVALHVETGIHRLALSGDDCRRLTDDGLPNGLQPVLIMSHLASADDETSDMTAAQLSQFTDLCERWPGVRRSLANSAGILANGGLGFDLVRPGIALYGCSAAPTALDGRLRPVATFDVPVLQLRELPAGVGVGYGATVVTQRPTRVAVLAGGYADGINRLAGELDGDDQRAPVAVGAARLTYFGRVSMDLAAVDVTDLPTNAVRVGTRCEVFGATVSAAELARHCHTLPYELLTGIGGRTQRIYTGAEYGSDV
ncbi:MAG: alanine racemase [Pseudomonadota bacterium]